MRIAIVGSRSISNVPIENYVSDGDEIVSGGAAGVDSCAAQYAREKGLALTVFPPRYDLYGKAAPIKRNEEIVDYSDEIVVFWDGCSRGAASVIKYAEKKGKSCEIILCE